MDLRRGMDIAMVAMAGIGIRTTTMKTSGILFALFVFGNVDGRNVFLKLMSILVYCDRSMDVMRTISNTLGNSAFLTYIIGT
jgi:hypothetical protein